MAAPSASMRLPLGRGGLGLDGLGARSVSRGVFSSRSLPARAGCRQPSGGWGGKPTSGISSMGSLTTSPARAFSGGFWPRWAVPTGCTSAPPARPSRSPAGGGRGARAAPFGPGPSLLVSPGCRPGTLRRLPWTTGFSIGRCKSFGFAIAVGSRCPWKTLALLVCGTSMQSDDSSPSANSVRLTSASSACRTASRPLSRSGTPTCPS